MNMQKEQMQKNNTRLTSIIEALKNKITGSVQELNTCSVRMICNQDGKIAGFHYLAYRNGVLTPVYIFSRYESSIDIEVSDVICGGYIHVMTTIEHSLLGLTVDGEATCEIKTTLSAGMGEVMIYAPNIAGSTSTITITDLD